MLSTLLNEEAVLAGLYERIQSGQFFHGVIMEGENSEEAARAYAISCVCSDDTPPCGICSDCKKALKDIHPDIITVHGTGATQSISVDTIRSVREDAYKKPNEAKRKVYLLLKSEAMTPEAQNAFLKILEEPPLNVIFILSCKTIDGLLPTIMSRCQLFSLPKDADDPEAMEKAEEFAEMLLNSNEMDYLTLSSVWINQKDFCIRIVFQLKKLFHYSLIGRLQNSYISDTAEKLGGILTEERLLRLYDLSDDFLKKQENRKLSLNQALAVSSFFADAISIRYGSFTTIKKASALER